VSAFQEIQRADGRRARAFNSARWLRAHAAFLRGRSELRRAGSQLAWRRGGSPLVASSTYSARPRVLPSRRLMPPVAPTATSRLGGNRRVAAPARRAEPRRDPASLVQREMTLRTASPAADPATRRGPARPSISTSRLMLAVVAEKTGYPSEMLGPGWSSRPTSASTRSSASRSCPPCASAPGPARARSRRARSLRTLGEIVDHLRRQLSPRVFARPSSASPRASANLVAAAATAANVDLEATCSPSSPRRPATPPR
jgi:hypothetical protein